MEQQRRAAAAPAVQEDNARVRVTEWRFPPGAATGWHVHEYDYVVVPTTDGTLRLETPDGTATAELRHGVPYYRKAGVAHDVINAGSAELVFVEVEIKAHGIETGQGG